MTNAIAEKNILAFRINIPCYRLKFTCPIPMTSFKVTEEKTENTPTVPLKCQHPLKLY